jgi:hypothetical protein
MLMMWRATSVRPLARALERNHVNDAIALEATVQALERMLQVGIYLSPIN